MKTKHNREKYPITETEYDTFEHLKIVEFSDGKSFGHLAGIKNNVLGYRDDPYPPVLSVKDAIVGKPKNGDILWINRVWLTDSGHVIYDIEADFCQEKDGFYTIAPNAKVTASFMFRNKAFTQISYWGASLFDPTDQSYDDAKCVFNPGGKLKKQLSQDISVFKKTCPEVKRVRDKDGFYDNVGVKELAWSIDGFFQPGRHSDGRAWNLYTLEGYNKMVSESNKNKK